MLGEWGTELSHIPFANQGLHKVATVALAHSIEAANYEEYNGHYPDAVCVIPDFDTSQ